MYDDSANEGKEQGVSIDYEALQNKVIAEFPRDIVTVEDAVEVSRHVYQAIRQATGEATVVEPAKRIERTDKDFTDGLCSGYLYYFDQYQGRVLTDQDLYRVFAECLTDERYTQQFNVGWCVSFVEALLEDRDPFARPETA